MCLGKCVKERFPIIEGESMLERENLSEQKEGRYQGLGEERTCPSSPYGPLERQEAPQGVMA